MACIIAGGSTRNIAKPEPIRPAAYNTISVKRRK